MLHRDPMQLRPRLRGRLRRRLRGRPFGVAPVEDRGFGSIRRTTLSGSRTGPRSVSRPQFSPCSSASFRLRAPAPASGFGLAAPNIFYPFYSLTRLCLGGFLLSALRNRAMELSPGGSPGTSWQCDSARAVPPGSLRAVPRQSIA